MEIFRPPGPMNFSGNIDENWRKWVQKFNIYMQASQKSELKPATKVAILLNLIGDAGLEVYNTFSFEKEEDKVVYEVVLKKFQDYCEPRKNVTYERFKFYSCKQKQGQDFEHYLVELQTLASNCEFKETEAMCRDQIIMGIQNEALKERLLREPSLNLDQVVSYCRAAEVSRKQAQDMREPIGATSVDEIKARKPLSGSRGNVASRGQGEFKMEDRRKECLKCGTKHKYFERCPAQGKICAKCGKRNHFARLCLSKGGVVSSRNRKPEGNQRRTVHQLQQDRDTSENQASADKLFICDINTNNTTFWQSTVRVGKFATSIKFKLDTGAEISVLPENYFKKLKTENSELNLEPTKVTLVTFGNKFIKPLGIFEVACLSETNEKATVKFVVVDEENAAMPLLGLQACTDLKLVKRIGEINDKSQAKNSVFERYKDVFTGIGKIPGEPYRITLSEDAKPVVIPTRRIPIALHDKLKQTLDGLEKAKIIRKVNKPTKWVNALVVVQKPNGTLRLCLDPKYLNESIRREHFPIPTLDDLIASLTGQKYFTVLDLKDGFYQIPIDDFSADLCTFGTPFGRYQFLRMPFGISSAPEVFQRKTSELFSDIKGVFTYFDDIIVSGETKEQHDLALETLLARAKTLNVKFNPDKFQYNVSEVKYFGHVISADGIKPDPDLVKAIIEMKDPEDKQGLLRFLGTLKYFNRFIPNLSQVTGPLRDLTKKNVQWQWDEVQREAVIKAKKLLTNAPVLRFYNVNEEVVIQTDASRDGLGSCLLQDGRPVAFASRSLSAAEQRYAQIEKEMLAICFAVEKFHQFVYGRKNVKVQTDHKPLESIVKKDLNEVTARLQRMLLKLLKYDLCVVYLPGKEMYLADTLSRAFLNTEECLDYDSDYEVVHSISLNVPMTVGRKQEFQKETREDAVLKELMRLCQEGWPKRKSDVPLVCRFYWSMKDKILTEDGLVFVDHKIIVPVKLRLPMLNLIHEGHQGICKSKARAREIMYWPNMSVDIENVVLKCQVCDQYCRNNPKEPLKSHDVPERPWQVIGVDLMQFGAQNFLVVIDYYSKWIELLEMAGKTAEEVIEKLKSVFSRFGVPNKVMSDNMPFSSYVFKKFAMEWNFEIVTSSPGYPKSNGLAEKAVGICKNILRKGCGIYEALLSHRNTPMEGIGLSPAQLMFGRRLKDKLPACEKFLQPKTVLGKQVRNKLLKRQNQQKGYYNKTARPLGELKDGVPIYLKIGKKWKPGTVLRKHSTPRSYMVKDFNGTVYRRNRSHLRYRHASYPSLNSAFYDDDCIGKIGSYNETNKLPPKGLENSKKTRYGRTVKPPVRFPN